MGAKSRSSRNHASTSAAAGPAPSSSSSSSRAPSGQKPSVHSAGAVAAGFHQPPTLAHSANPKDPVYAPPAAGANKHYGIAKRHQPPVPSASSKAKVITLDVATLEPPVLRKYRDVYRLRTKKPSREDLAAAVARHFSARTVRETESITQFLYAARNRGKLLKLHPPPNL